MSDVITQQLHDRIVLVFDFDLTLSNGSIDAVLRHMGAGDGERWFEERVQPLIDDGWDEILARASMLARTGEELHSPITQSLINEVGRGLSGYPGLDEALGALRELGRAASQGAAVEFYVLSSGFVDIMTPSPIARHFNAIWGSSLNFDGSGRLAGVKRTITHSEKARYLRALAKGLSIAGANEPADIELPRPLEEWHVPLDQMIYVGDGASDIAAFNLMHENGGIAIAVDGSGDGRCWSARRHMFEAARVENLAAPDYRPGSELRRSLGLAVEIIAKRIALRRLSVGE